MKFKILSWDSKSFGFKVARIKQYSLNRQLLQDLKREGIELCYFFTEYPLKEINNPFYEINLVDKKVTYSKVPQHYSDDSSILSYPKGAIDKALFNLTLRSGKYSRFNLDKRIGKQKFELLYETWIERSVSREIADEVFVYYLDNKIVGFVTVRYKNENAEIGIIAVDENFTKMGIGKALMEKAESSRKANCSKIKVVTQLDNIPACRLYESCSYVVEKIEYVYHLWRK